MPTYWWKAKPEITWAVSLAVLSYLITVLADPGILTAQTWADWRKIVLAAVVGCLRAGIGAVIAQAGPGGFKPDDPPGPVAPPRPATLSPPAEPTPADVIVAALDADNDALRRDRPPPRG